MYNYYADIYDQKEDYRKIKDLTKTTDGATNRKEGMTQGLGQHSNARNPNVREFKKVLNYRGCQSWDLALQRVSELKFYLTLFYPFLIEVAASKKNSKNEKICLLGFEMRYSPG